MNAEASGYVDPGSYVTEVIQPGSVAITSDRSLCIVAIAPRTRRTTDEAIVRGKVYDEALTVWSAATPFVSTLANVSNHDRTNAELRMNNAKLDLAFWAFQPAQITGLVVAAAGFDTTTKHRISISMDGKAFVMLDLITQGIATLLTTVVSELNAALAAVTAYGATYNAVFTTITTTNPDDTVVITSPVSTAASDIQILFSLEDAGVDEDMTDEILVAGDVPTSTVGTQAPTQVRVVDAYYSASNTYEIDYVTVDTQVDPLTNATATNTLDDIVAVGNNPGTPYYTDSYDYEESTNDIDWVTTSWTQGTITAVLGPYDTTTNTDIRLAINGNAPITITLTSGAATTAAVIAEDINTRLNTSADYGPQYAYFASDSAGTLVLTVPTQLENSPIQRGGSTEIVFYAVTLDIFPAMFGILATSQPYTVNGTGKRPSFGSVYYANYDYDRPSTDYDEPVKVFDPAGLYTYTSPKTVGNYTSNLLAIAGEICFENESPDLWLQQVNDSTAPGSPTPTQIKTAIDNCSKKSGITDVVVIAPPSTHAADIANHLMAHVASMCSQTEKKYRRGWYGMPRGTDVGDPDTLDTFVYWATRNLQTVATSPGRGRAILVAPSEGDRVITLESGAERTLEVDGSYMAAAVAARFESLPKPSSPLLGSLVTGFESTNFETYLQGERYTLAENGVTVITMDAGKFELLDPLTTEAGGGSLVQFEEIGGSAQKDGVSRAVNSVLDGNVKGLVPTDLADFIVDIKQWVSLAIKSQINAGNIAPYRNANGTIRDIDLASDIKVTQSSTDQRTFNFQYWFNLLYPAKRFFGEYSVDNPFFTA